MGYLRGGWVARRVPIFLIGAGLLWLLLVPGVGPGVALAGANSPGVDPASLRDKRAFTALKELGLVINLGYSIEHDKFVEDWKAGKFKHPGPCPVGKAWRKKIKGHEWRARTYVSLLLCDWVWDSSVNPHLDHFDAVRLPVAANEFFNGNRIDPAYLQIVEEIAGNAIRKGNKTVIIDLHQFNKKLAIDPATASQNTERLRVLWAELGTRFAGFPIDRVYFEVLNEPLKQRRTGYAYCPSQWRQDVRVAIDAIRASDARNHNRPILIGACNPDDWQTISNPLKEVFRELRASSKMNPLIATFHYYDPFSVTSWRHRCHAEPPVRSNCPRDGDHPVPASLSDQKQPWQTENQRKLENVANFLEREQIPVLLGEIGFEAHKPHLDGWQHLDKPGTKGVPDVHRKTRERLKRERCEWVVDMITRAKSFGMGVGYWNLFGSFGFMDSDGALTDAKLLDAIGKAWRQSDRHACRATR